MQLFQDTKSSDAIGDDSDQSRDLPSDSSNRPSRELMRLVFPDGTVRTVDPEADND